MCCDMEHLKEYVHGGTSAQHNMTQNIWMNFESPTQTAVFIQSSQVLPRQGGGFGMSKNCPGGEFVKVCLDLKFTLLTVYLRAWRYITRSSGCGSRYLEKHFYGADPRCRSTHLTEHS